MYSRIKIHLLVILLLAGAGTSLLQAQSTDSILVSGFFKNNSGYTEAEVYRFWPEEEAIAKAPIREGRFRVALPKQLPKGLYRLRYNTANPAEAIDLILAGEPQVSFELDPGSKDQPLVFTASQQNKDWYSYRFALQEQMNKIDMLTEFINRYPTEKEAAVLAAQKSLKREQAAARNIFQQFVARQGDSWPGKMAKNRPLWFADPKEQPKTREKKYHVQYWQGIHTSDTTLLNSPLYAEHIYNYLRYYLSPEMGWTGQELEKGFKQAVDTIVQKFSAYPSLRKFALQFITKGFRQIGQETVLQYIDEKYNRQEQCSSDQADTALQKRLAAYEALKPGAPAPDIVYASSEKTNAGLKDIAADTVIVAFWASWCPHCTEAMPRVNALTAGRQSIKVLAVSLDEDPKAYMEAAGKLNNMLHLCDYRKWNSQPVVDYHITATPTFFMLDRERRIIGRYNSVENLAPNLAITAPGQTGHDRPAMAGRKE